MFLADPLDVPAELVDYLAEQLGIKDASCVKQYTEREKTNRLHHVDQTPRSRFRLTAPCPCRARFVHP